MSSSDWVPTSSCSDTNCNKWTIHTQKICESCGKPNSPVESYSFPLPPMIDLKKNGYEQYHDREKKYFSLYNKK